MVSEFAPDKHICIPLSTLVLSFYLPSLPGVPVALTKLRWSVCMYVCTGMLRWGRCTREPVGGREWGVRVRGFRVM